MLGIRRRLNCSILVAMLLASCASYPAMNSLEAAVAVAVKERFGLHEQPIFISDAKSCRPAALQSEATIEVAELEALDAPQRFKSGVFVLCNVTESGGRTHATLQRVLHHASLGRFVVSESGEIELRRGANGWRVIALSLTAIDYPPPGP